MTTCVFCILILYKSSFPPVTYSQSTPNFTLQTNFTLSADITDNPSATTNQSPLAATTNNFREESNSPVSPTSVDATFTDATAGQNTSSITKQTTNPTG